MPSGILHLSDHVYRWTMWILLFWQLLRFLETSSTNALPLLRVGMHFNACLRPLCRCAWQVDEGLLHPTNLERTAQQATICRSKLMPVSHRATLGMSLVKCFLVPNNQLTVLSILHQANTHKTWEALNTHLPANNFMSTDHIRLLHLIRQSTRSRTKPGEGTCILMTDFANYSLRLALSMRVPLCLRPDIHRTTT
jgi:hypothetical protein